MYKITVKGEAKTEYPYPEDIHGVECEDEFTEYFHDRYKDDPNEEALIKKGVKNGYMSFVYEDGTLYTITEYDSPQELTPEELEILKNYTSGQWSDGIGEGFEQFSCMNGKRYEREGYDEECDDKEYKYTREVFVSPWHRNQVITIEQKLK